jgi:type VI secretion system protein ImpL
MKKNTWIAVLIFVVYLALVIAVGHALHFDGARSVIFSSVLGVVGALAIVAAMLYQHELIDLSGVPEASAADSEHLDALVRAAEAHLKASSDAGRSLASMPLVYVIGDENSAKTQTVLQSGLDAELMAGEVYRGTMVAPTPLINIWYSAAVVVVEAGSALLRQPKLWQRLVRLTQPSNLGSALKKGALQSSRAAIVCVSIERVAPSNTAESVRNLGKMLNERLRLLTQTLGISLPVYVIFTKLDTVPAFADFAANLTEEEAHQPVGALLARPDARVGNYAERASAKIAERFDELCYSLAKFRIDVLSRGGEPEKLAKAYEFPREVRKMRSTIVDLLVEVGCPSQLGVTPFLRGFYFSGLRARLVDDGAGDAAKVQAPGTPDATTIFTPGAVAGAPPPRRALRRAPQWVFLPHLFSRVILNDQSALQVSRISTKVYVVKRALIASVAACFFLYLVALTTSYLNNSSLDGRLRAAAAVAAQPVGPDDTVSDGDLRNLEQLRLILAQAAAYRKNGAPFPWRWGLFDGERLYDKACAAYGSHFRTLLLAPAQDRLVAHLNGLPATWLPSDDYSAAYRPLRAYLITTSNPEKSTGDFLPDALQQAWIGNHTYSPDDTALSLVQFQTYATNLTEPDSCMAPLGGPAHDHDPEVAKARAYLNRFQDVEQVYVSMKNAANRSYPAIRFNEDFPNSARYIVESFDVEGAFSKEGYAFMRDAIRHPQLYTSGDEWVLGPSTGAKTDLATLTAQLPSLYLNDYLNAWRSYLKTARVMPGNTLLDSRDKLQQFAGPSSVLLELFQVISTNTSVADPAFSRPFLATQSVVAPNSTALPTGTPYIQSLASLDKAIGAVLRNPHYQTDPNSVQPIMAAARTAEAAAKTIGDSFPPDPAGGMDAVSRRLLLAPIQSVERIAEAVREKAVSDASRNVTSVSPSGLGPTGIPLHPKSGYDFSVDEVAASVRHAVVFRNAAYHTAESATVHPAARQAKPYQKN